MGFFSFLTSDTEESISSTYSDRGAKTVYLLQPNGEDPIKEDSYEGYGEFGGVDVYEWLARHNLPKNKIASMSKGMIRKSGLALALGKYYLHRDTGQKWSIFHGYAYLIKGCKDFRGSYATTIAEYGKTPAELIESGEFQEFKIAKNLKFPLKFSFDKDADYDSLPPAKNCPNQGYFYG